MTNRQLAARSVEPCASRGRVCALFGTGSYLFVILLLSGTSPLNHLFTLPLYGLSMCLVFVILSASTTVTGLSVARRTVLYPAARRFL